MDVQRPRYLKELIEKKDNGRVKIITGIRRCGKTYLLFELYRKHLLSTGVKENQIIMIALDSIENLRYRNPIELYEFFRERIQSNGNKHYIFIDEIQFVEEISNPYLEGSDSKVSFVDLVIGLMKIPNTDVYITGSNSNHLIVLDIGSTLIRVNTSLRKNATCCENWQYKKAPMSGAISCLN